MKNTAGLSADPENDGLTHLLLLTSPLLPRCSTWTAFLWLYHPHVRASFSQERMQYLNQEGKVVYAAKDGETTKSFPALEWLAAMCSHIPNRGEQIVRYYGYYSNVSRGERQKEGSDDVIPCILEPQGNEKAFRKSWARLIQKIYEVDPLVCPKCKGAMRISSSIEEPSVIRAILDHLGLWLARARPPPKIHDPPVCLQRVIRFLKRAAADPPSLPNRIASSCFSIHNIP